MQKSEIRKLALSKRNSFTSKERSEKSERIAEHLESLNIFKNAKNILFYYSYQAEVDTLGLMKKWMENKNILLPRLNSDNTFVALPFTSFDNLEVNKFDIPEPPFIFEPQTNLDLIIVPGVAFDRKGNRIGMGKGYYDRFLTDYKNVPKIALAYSEQVLDQVPKDPYDEPVNIILTEDEIIQVSS